MAKGWQDVVVQDITKVDDRVWLEAIDVALIPHFSQFVVVGDFNLFEDGLTVFVEFSQLVLGFEFDFFLGSGGDGRPNFFTRDGIHAEIEAGRVNDLAVLFGFLFDFHFVTP